MAEVLIVPPGTISPRDRRDLRSAGVVVVETDTPERCQFVRATSPLSYDDMLWAALEALCGPSGGGYGSDGGDKRRERLARNLFQLVVEKRKPPTSDAPAERPHGD